MCVCVRVFVFVFWCLLSVLYSESGCVGEGPRRRRWCIHLLPMKHDSLWWQTGQQLAVICPSEWFLTDDSFPLQKCSSSFHHLWSDCFQNLHFIAPVRIALAVHLYKLLVFVQTHTDKMTSALYFFFFFLNEFASVNFWSWWMFASVNFQSFFLMC